MNNKPVSNKGTTGQNHIQIPEDSYALMFHKDGKVEIVTPHGENMTNGHILLLGIIDLLKTDNWADDLIDQTADLLNEIPKT